MKHRKRALWLPAGHSEKNLAIVENSWSRECHRKKKQCLECCNSLKQSPPQTEKQNSSTFCCPKTEKKSTMFSVIKDFLETVAI